MSIHEYDKHVFLIVLLQIRMFDCGIIAVWLLNILFQLQRVIFKLIAILYGLYAGKEEHTTYDMWKILFYICWIHKAQYIVVFWMLFFLCCINIKHKSIFHKHKYLVADSETN